MSIAPRQRRSTRSARPRRHADTNPHDVLGAHAGHRRRGRGRHRARVPPGRDRLPSSSPAARVPPHRAASMAGLFAAFLPGATVPLRYRLRFRFADGTHLGARRSVSLPGRRSATSTCTSSTRARTAACGRCSARTCARVDGTDGVAFAVWAPNAQRVERRRRLLRLGRPRSSRCAARRVRRLGALRPRRRRRTRSTSSRSSRAKARSASRPIRSRGKIEQPPGTASRVVAVENLSRGATTRGCARARADDLGREPMAIYEVHLGSWARVPEEGNRSLAYREIAPRLAEHVQRTRLHARRADARSWSIRSTARGATR